MADGYYATHSSRKECKDRFLRSYSSMDLESIRFDLQKGTSRAPRFVAVFGHFVSVKVMTNKIAAPSYLEACVFIDNQ